MPRAKRFARPDSVHHVINRANDRRQLFDSPSDYDEFLRLIAWAKERCRIRILAFCVMPNHWHFLLWPGNENEIPKFIHRLTTTHSVRRRRATNSVGFGHVYQHRYHSFLVDSESYYFKVIHYIEANPLRAGLVSSAKDWAWSSLMERRSAADQSIIDSGPLVLPPDWDELVDEPLDLDVLQRIRSGFQQRKPIPAIHGPAELVKPASNLT